MQPDHTLKDLSWTGELLTIDWADGHRSTFPAIWLRDNCPADRDSQNGQRLIDITDLPPDLRIRSASVRLGALQIEWENDTRAAVFDLHWLQQYAPGSTGHALPSSTRLWLDGSKLDQRTDFAWSDFPRFRDAPSARLVWLERLLQDGIAFLSAVPCNDQAVLEPARLLGFIQETNYGRVFNVHFLPHAENLADSDRGLGLHTDNPYRDPVPGFQMLHILVIAPEGGESLFADGFAFAKLFHDTQPDFFEILARTPVPFLFRSKDAELFSERPLIQLSHRGEVQAIHYNSRSIAPLSLTASVMAPFYEAYRAFASLLRVEAFQLRFKLEPGELAVFDNRRILHGRTEFSSSRHERRLQGCYLTRDSVLSTAAVLRRNLNQRGFSDEHRR